MKLAMQRAIYQKNGDKLFLHRGDLEKTFLDEKPKTEDGVIYTFCYLWLTTWLAESECPRNEDTNGTLMVRNVGDIKVEFIHEVANGTFFLFEDLLNLVNARQKFILGQMSELNCPEGDAEVVKAFDKIRARLKTVETVLRQAQSMASPPPKKSYYPEFSLN